MAFRVVIPKSVQKDIAKIDQRYQTRITVALASLQSNPFIGKKLEGEHKGQWSYRVWPYRIIYTIYKKELIVIIFTHRS